MSKKHFGSELARALARPDLDELKRLLELHRNRDPTSSGYSHACDVVLTSWRDDPELALALAVLAGATYDDPEFLASIAAGIMEDLLRNPANGMAVRIAEEARRHARFRWMLSGVWLHAIHPDNVETVRDAVADMSMDNGDPLPPRPWA